MKSFIHKLVRDVGKIHMRNMSKIKTTQSKEYKDIVTNVDIQSEKLVMATIRKKFPSHSIISEESPPKMKQSDYTWVIDPLDGTVNYAAGLPLFSVTIGLLHQEKPILGIVYAPCLNELFFTERGKGAFLNGKKISVSKKRTLRQSIIHVGFGAHYSPSLMKKNTTIVARIAPKVMGLRALESGSLSSCYVACGRLDGKISIKTVAFDNTPTTLLIQEAGGRVTDFAGKPWNLQMKDMVCSNPYLSKPLRSLIK